MLLKNACINKNITDIEISEKKIINIGKCENYSGEIIDLGGLKVFPGLIDIHSHGCMGHDTMDGLYEFFATALYEYMKAGNRFDLIPREDFKGSLSVVKKPKDKKVRDSRDPKTGKSLGTFEYTNESYHSVVASSPCPSYLKGRKKIK